MIDKKSFFRFENNSLIKITGDDRFNFIQGIISNDINNLKTKPSIYSSILTPQGRFISDFFLSNYKNSFLLEINKNDETDILQKLSIYKLRSKINISVVKNAEIFVISNDSEKSFREYKKESLCFNDPRFENIFKRLYLFNKKKNCELKKIGLNQISNENFDDLRLENAIPNFQIDATKEKSLLMEMRFDDLNGISWEKGCYLGQEITARMKYRNLMKKKIFHIKIDFGGSINNEIKFDQQVVGNITNHNKEFGMAYLNINFLKNFKKKSLICGDSNITFHTPWWSGSN